MVSIILIEYGFPLVFLNSLLFEVKLLSLNSDGNFNFNSPKKTFGPVLILKIYSNFLSSIYFAYEELISTLY